jgi:paraquat-inducible protein B
MQSLVTGQLMIELDFHPDSPLKLYGFKDIKLGEDVKEIPTIQSGLAQLGKKIEQLPLDEIANDLRSSLKGINEFVNSPEFGKSLHYFKQVLRDARNFVRHLDAKVDPLFDRVDDVLVNIDSQIEPLATGIKTTVEDTDELIRNVNKRIGPIQADLNKTTASLRAALNSAESALTEIDQMVEDDSEVRYYIDVFLREMTMAARSVRTLANYLERNPDALLRGKVSKTSGEEGR